MLESREPFSTKRRRGIPEMRNAAIAAAALLLAVTPFAEAQQPL
jgi:hypothetical protein